MNCVVCQASAAGPGPCPQCGYDVSQPGAKDPGRVVAAREAFRARTLAYAPDSRVGLRDKLVPWAGLVLGVGLLLLWLRACSSVL